MALLPAQYANRIFNKLHASGWNIYKLDGNLNDFDALTRSPVLYLRISNENSSHCYYPLPSTPEAGDPTKVRESLDAFAERLNKKRPKINILGESIVFPTAFMLTKENILIRKLIVPSYHPIIQKVSYADFLKSLETLVKTN